MNSAQRIIQKFGSQSALAALIGKRPPTVQYWCKTGIVPAKWQRILLKIAAQKGIELSAVEFMDDERANVAEMGNSGSKILRAKWCGVLPISDTELPVFVLENGMRVISCAGTSRLFSDCGKEGNLENHPLITSSKKYAPRDLPDLAVEFTLHIADKRILGYTAETVLEICEAYLRALTDDALATTRQKEIAINASEFLSACSKVGLATLIDQATGYDCVADARRRVRRTANSLRPSSRVS